MASDEGGAGSEIKDQAAIHLAIEVEVEIVECLLRIAKLACLRRRSSSRSLRLVNSSETRQESKSMGAMASAWA
jgi:hypothetical protein